MQLKHYSECKLRAEILEVIGRHLDLRRYRVFFFGSRVEGTHTEKSDIDIGIDGPEEIPGDIMVEIKEGIDKLPTLYRFDIVDFRKAAPEFREGLLKSVEYVN